MKKCPKCNAVYPENVFYCNNDKELLLYCSDEEAEAALLQGVNIPKCPTCQSTNIKKISTTSKIIGATAFGIFSKTARSQFQCNNCGYKG